MIEKYIGSRRSRLSLLTIVLALASATVPQPNVAGQSCFQLANKVTPIVDAPVYDAAGVPLAGPNYRAELWGATAPESLTPLFSLVDGGRKIVPFSTQGYFASSGSLCVFDANPGGFAWVQVRAWDARLGAKWEDAAALGMGGYGESALLFVDGGDPTLVPPELPGFLVGLQSFSLRPVPEPSTWLIGSLGIVRLWLKMRAKRKSDRPK